MTAHNVATSSCINPLTIEYWVNDWSVPLTVHVVAVGTREQLIERGLAGDYMFRALGDRSNKAARTEYGDRYHIERRTLHYEHFKLWLDLRKEPRNPQGLSHVDPYDTDITDILQAIFCSPTKAD